MGKFYLKNKDMDKRNFSNGDFDDILGIFLFILGFGILGFYGQFFISLLDKTFLLIILSLISTILVVVIRKYRDKCEEEISDFYLFICFIIRALNYMIVSIASYSIFIKIFNSILYMVNSDTLEVLNLILLAFCAIVPYMMQKWFCKKVFKVRI